jgi:hypothetical protein
MNKLIPFLVLAFLSTGFLNAQIIFEENFEGGVIPDGWMVQSSATDGGWLVGSSASISSQFFPITSNGSSGIAGTNDDDCNCDKSNEYLITPAIDLSDQSSVILSFDAFFTDDTYQGNFEDATIEVSTDGVNWEILEDLHGHSSWDTHTIVLNDYAGEATVYIGFRYDDGGGWLYGFAIDNVVVQVPATLEAEFIQLDSELFGEVNSGISIKGIVFNGGVAEINTLEINYTVDGNDTGTETFNNLTIEPFSYYSFEMATPWTPSADGIYDIEVSIGNVNGATDENIDNNSASFSPVIYPLVSIPNKIEAFLTSTPIISEITGAANKLDKPTDLDFFPILGKNELWIVNQRTENEGGSTLTIADATTDAPTEFLERVDGNAWHFMSLPTAIAFSPENLNFATSPGVQDANHNGGTFTGPTLWSSDPAIYAQPSGGNGSHLDMLHGSPYSMGIAHETENVFWVYDDWNKDIVRYDFVEDHGPGNDYHGDALVRRYGNMDIDADGNIPNHMILDKPSGWLYFVDNGSDRVLRLDINTGSGNSIPEINEALTEHSNITGFTYEVIIESGLDKPCGIEIFENRLLVGDYANGDIIVFDMDNDFAELGRIETGDFGLTGIKIGPDGNLWCTNRQQNKLIMVEPGEFTGTQNLQNKIRFSVFPNPTTGSINIEIPQLKIDEGITLTLSNAIGENLLEINGAGKNHQLDMADFPNGVYIVNILAGNYTGSKKVILNK